jgi:ribosome-associated protein
MKPAPLIIPVSELTFEFVRSPGAGGQNVNKVNSKARLYWNILASSSLPEDVRERFLARWASRINAAGEVVITSDRYRDQLKNKADTQEKLAAMIAAVAVPPTPRKKTKPTRGAKERRLGDKKRRADTKAMRKKLQF